MAHINLLPWREELRKERKVRFFTVSGIAAVVAAGVVVAVHLFFVQLIAYQNDRNQFLEGQIKLLDKKIKEIKNLEKERERLLARMRGIEQLQTSRPIIVHIFDQFVQTLPDGVYLTEISQKGKSFTVKGVAQSNARVSNFMRNLDASKWLTGAHLEVIETKQMDKRRLADFTLTVQEKGQKTGEKGEQKGGKGKGARS